MPSPSHWYESDYSFFANSDGTPDHNILRHFSLVAKEGIMTGVSRGRIVFFMLPACRRLGHNFRSLCKPVQVNTCPHGFKHSRVQPIWTVCSHWNLGARSWAENTSALHGLLCKEKLIPNHTSINCRKQLFSVVHYGVCPHHFHSG